MLMLRLVLYLSHQSKMLHQVIYRQLNYGIHRLQEKATLGLYLFAYLHLPHDDDENFENLFQEEKRELLQLGLR